MELKGEEKFAPSSDHAYLVQQIPLMFTEALKIKRGLSLVVGGRHSQRGLCWQSFLPEWALTPGQKGLVIANEKPVERIKDRSLIQFVSTKDWLQGQIRWDDLDFDLVIIDGVAVEKSLPEVIRWVENGVQVIWSISGTSLLNGLRQILSQPNLENSENFRGRLADVLYVGLYQEKVRGLRGDWILAHEVLVNRPDIRNLIRENNLSEIEVIQNSVDEQTGVLNFNQSLLQLIIRRRIELKTAFQHSKNPQLLDKILTKIGI